MTTQNQINLILQFMNANVIERAGMVRIDPHGNAIVYAIHDPSNNPCYYTISSIWDDEQLMAFTDEQIEQAVNEGGTVAIKMIAASIGDCAEI